VTRPIAARGSDDGVSQILANLLINAAQAAGAGGAITVRLQRKPSLAIIVEDDGPGLTPEVQQRVFDPFFTTRSVGQGTGLGLSVALGLARAMGCTLELTNRVGERGARATLTWPAESDRSAA
jgi:signal transduction histidine kinase